ncbi:50S ribosomal protein L17 [Deferrisoma camini]|uniref:50S ribosomal protein L17 n=1 Tax=Deferrisoma camini TaxID=1035120 RepID=UPI00046D1169|nr:50S ribosomal protein L17 [Deferrisoma camini]
MRHRKSGRKLGRDTAHRKAMLRNLVTSLIEHGRVQTTDAKAKEARRVAEKLITLARQGTLHARRQALAYVRGRDAVARLFEVVAPRYQDRPGGYTRIVKLGYRRGDNAPVSLLELVDGPYAGDGEQEAEAATSE